MLVKYIIILGREEVFCWIICFVTFLAQDLGRISLHSDPFHKIRENEIKWPSID